MQLLHFNPLTLSRGKIKKLLTLLICSHFLITMANKKLTARQQEVLNFVRKHHARNEYWPSIRDIQQHFGFKSTNGVFGHLKALMDKGAIVRVPGRARAFQIASQPSRSRTRKSSGVPAKAMDVLEIPVYGNIAAGYPNGIESGDAVGRIQIDTATIGLRSRRDVFALKVRGDSMIDAGIFDGDTVILEQRRPRNHDIVAALIDGETTLKRFIQLPDSTPYLKAENPEFPELHPLSELIVQGVAKAVVRKL